ncbi:uncharacterized protein PFL1_03509 [Pseudozyma flocculosa PF-1]|uniref:Related to 2,4-dihydroxyhept-2-ene-1,7-dioic acid aldolase n=2 Tax=Pseudozyma flocculosa TaxID=84751 RepID=A0A5C3FCS1_9BASI|nr:uncharacterized protein PFL1_03509 [Pseudozyma flocculosa PF-1]EPQ29222.1 hypothetical protein PFL1_03509 [Pseudozyma flocculosa PF-1]SPO41475.1 related to 2,4-dihydroxyhept-2-ene-1,7-dioic acid aldolase [Pseudozyma flocculosa]
MMPSLTPVPNHLARRLRNGQLGTAITARLVDKIDMASLAYVSGWHSVLIDLEHSVIGQEAAIQLTRACILAGIAPVIRVPQGDAAWLGRALDAGAQGVIVPHVDTADEARRIVQQARHFPRGHRSFTYSFPSLHHQNLPPQQAFDYIDSETLVFCMLESRTAIANAEEIAAVEGFDVLLIGSADLTTDMGISCQFDHPDYDAAVLRVCDVAKRHGKIVGLGGIQGRPDLLKRYIDHGARFIMGGADWGMLLAAFQNQQKSLMTLLPDQDEVKAAPLQLPVSR